MVCLCVGNDAGYENLFYLDRRASQRADIDTQLKVIT